VNGGTAATSGPGDDRPRSGALRCNTSPLSSGSKALEGRNASRGNLFRSRWKRGEPHGRFRVQHPGAVEEEKPVEVVRNHEGGTRSGVATPIRRRERGNTRPWPSGLLDWHDGEAIFDNPMRGCSTRECRAARIGTRQESRRATIKRVERSMFERVLVGPVRRSLKVRVDAARAASRTRRRRAVTMPDGHDDRQGFPPYASSPVPGHPPRSG